ncbi:MAG: hypothetical protein K6E15_12720 [Prevotella sp.]|nr:hypothetical protein [Prevotella sp.]
MTTSDQENIERKLKHVLEMGNRIIDLYRHITCTERVALLLAMTAAVRQTAANMQTVAALLRKNLLDPFRIDYTGYAREIENLHSIWEDELKGAPIFHNLDNRSRPLTNPHDIALKEDTDYDLTIRTEDEDKFDFLETRVGMMRNASLMCEAIDHGLIQIGRTLREIVEDYLRLKSDTTQQEKRLNELERQYEEMMWEVDQERLIGEVKEYIVLCNNNSCKDTYELFLDRMDRQATDPHDIKILAELNEWYLAGQSPALFIVENRDKLNIEDIARHFCFVRCRRLVAQKVESFDLLQPADEQYRDLFMNKAAQELAILMAVTIGTYVDFRHNYQYAALQMAMQDLGLVYSDNRNGIQMRDFINKEYLKNDKPIIDQKTITEWTGKLFGSMFGAMDEQHLLGNYSQADFNKMKDYYWLCLSIINKVVQLDLEELNFAPYLYEEHEKTPSITDYKNSEGQSIMERLSILKSVIKGETLLG